MRRPAAAAALLVLCLAACARLPGLVPPGPGMDLPAACEVPLFVTRPCRLVHAIEAEFARGRGGVFMGVTVADPGRRHLEAALLTLEGLVLFEARSHGALQVQRHLPPFDRPGFAQGLFQDLEMLFFPPPEGPALRGRLADGSAVCRYPAGDGTTVDLVRPAGGDWEIRRYGARGRLTRRARPCRPAGPGPPDCVHLEALGTADYRLTLRLLESEALTGLEP